MSTLWHTPGLNCFVNDNSNKYQRSYRIQLKLIKEAGKRNDKCKHNNGNYMRPGNHPVGDPFVNTIAHQINDRAAYHGKDNACNHFAQRMVNNQFIPHGTDDQCPDQHDMDRMIFQSKQAGVCYLFDLPASGFAADIKINPPYRQAIGERDDCRIDNRCVSHLEITE